MDNEISAKIFAAMQEGKPYKSYKKGILAKVYVNILNPLTGKPESIILSGDPRKNDEKSIIDVWSPGEDAYIKRMNEVHFKRGTIIEFKRPGIIEMTEEEKLNSMNDDGLAELLTSPFYKLQSSVNKMTSPVPVYRMLDLAKDMEKSEKILNMLRARLSELDSSVEEIPVVS